jgi:rubrerythrin
MLADEEQKHLDIVNRLKNEVPKRITGTDVISDAKQIFEKMQAGKEQFELDTDELEVYKKARQIEFESKKYYLDKAGDIDDDAIANVLTRLAKEEDKHYRLMDGIVEMVARPQRWLENAEWYHIEEY